MSKKLFFIFNPKAGKGQIRNSLADIIDVFNKYGYEVIVRATQGPKDAYEMTKEYEDKVDAIICSGGDGTLDEVVTGIMEKGSHAKIGYIPAGSTNDFAASMFMPRTMIGAAENIMSGEIYQCDIGRFNSQTFAYVAAFGIFTDVSYQTGQGMKNIFGHGAYFLEGVKRIFDIKSYHMRVEAKELTAEADFIYGMVTNSRSIGGFKNLTGKNVDMDDGLFEVTLIRMPQNPMELQEIITALLTEEDNTDLIYSFKTARIRLISEEPVAWTLDGEFGGDHREAEIENLHKALNLLLRSTKEDEWKNSLM